MKASDKCLLHGTIYGLIVGGGLVWLLPGMHWALYLGAGLIAAAAGYQGELKHKANERLVDSDFEKSS